MTEQSRWGGLTEIRSWDSVHQVISVFQCSAQVRNDRNARTGEDSNKYYQQLKQSHTNLHFVTSSKYFSLWQANNSGIRLKYFSDKIVCLEDIKQSCLSSDKIFSNYWNLILNALWLWLNECLYQFSYSVWTLSKFQLRSWGVVGWNFNNFLNKILLSRCRIQQKNN